VRKSVLVGAGLLSVATLAVIGIARAAQKTMLPSISTERRHALLVGMARMRPISSVVAYQGAIPGRSLAVEARPTTPASWEQSALSWVEKMSADGYSIAFWDDGDASHTALVAFGPEDEAAMAPYGARGKAGWSMLLGPKQFEKVLAGESRQDLLEGIVRQNADGTPTGLGGFEHFAAAAGPIPGWHFEVLTDKLSSSPVKGQRYMGVLSGALKGRAIVEGFFQGFEGGKGQLLVDRIVEVQDEPAPEKGLYDLYEDAKIPSTTTLQKPLWQALDPTSVSARSIDITKIPKAGQSTYLAIREANPLGRAVMIIQGTVLPAEPGDDPLELRISAGDPVTIKRGGKDVAYPPLMFVTPEFLIDPSSLAN